MHYPKKNVRLPVIWSADKVGRLIDAAPTPFYRTILMTLYATGMRRAEVAALKLCDVDSASGRSFGTLSKQEFQAKLHVSRGGCRRDSAE
jgi:integrase